MANTGRIPLWLIALIGGFAALSVLALFFYGAYSGLGSSL
jgi:photosystem II PsbJ protein